MPNSITILLNKRFAYFKLLNEEEQKRFINRIRLLRHEKKIVGRGMEVTAEMEIPGMRSHCPTHSSD